MNAGRRRFLGGAVMLWSRSPWPWPSSRTRATGPEIAYRIERFGEEGQEVGRGRLLRA